MNPGSVQLKLVHGLRQARSFASALTVELYWVQLDFCVDRVRRR